MSQTPDSTLVYSGGVSQVQLRTSQTLWYNSLATVVEDATNILVLLLLSRTQPTFCTTYNFSFLLNYKASCPVSASECEPRPLECVALNNPFLCSRAHFEVLICQDRFMASLLVAPKFCCYGDGCLVFCFLFLSCKKSTKQLNSSPSRESVRCVKSWWSCFLVLHTKGEKN